MNIFTLPKKFYEMLRMRAENPNKFQKHPTAWFFSSEGKHAYDCANSLTERILYFQKYLESLPIKGKILPDDLYKIACIMADAMDYSGLCFAGYPNILMPEFNPLIRFLQNPELEHYAPEHIPAKTLLRTLHGNAPDDSYESHLPINQSNISFYLLEKKLIWAFYNSEEKTDTFRPQKDGPYAYSCTQALPDPEEHTNELKEVEIFLDSLDDDCEDFEDEGGDWDDFDDVEDD